MRACTIRDRRVSSGRGSAPTRTAWTTWTGCAGPTGSYLTVVVDHDARRLVWAAPGRDKATLHRFFDALGEARCAVITHVSADAADWIAAVVAARCPHAVRCADPFHVVAWATDALDEERRRAWNDARGAAQARRAPRATGTAKALKHARYALWKLSRTACGTCWPATT